MNEKRHAFTPPKRGSPFTSIERSRRRAWRRSKKIMELRLP